jgi:hypothetical protein
MSRRPVDLSTLMILNSLSHANRLTQDLALLPAIKSSARLIAAHSSRHVCALQPRGAREAFPGTHFPVAAFYWLGPLQVLSAYKPDWNRVPATSAYARLSALDVPTAVAAARASTA